MPGVGGVRYRRAPAEPCDLSDDRPTRSQRLLLICLTLPQPRKGCFEIRVGDKKVLSLLVRGGLQATGRWLRSMLHISAAEPSPH